MLKKRECSTMWLAKANPFDFKFLAMIKAPTAVRPAQSERKQVLKMIDYIIGGVLAVLALLALRSVLKKSKDGGCAGCSGCTGCGSSCSGHEHETANK